MTRYDEMGLSTMATDLHTCENCGGTFPGEGVTSENHVYCTDLCAEADIRRRNFMTNPYVIGGAFTVGFLLGSGILGFRSIFNAAMFAEKYRLRDLVMSRLGGQP